MKLCHFVSTTAAPEELAPWLIAQHADPTAHDADAVRWPTAGSAGSAGLAIWLIDALHPQSLDTLVPQLTALEGRDHRPWALWWVGDMPVPAAHAEQAWALGALAILSPGAHLQTQLAALASQLASPCHPSNRLRVSLQEHQALQAALDNIPAPIFIKSALGRYTECNQAFLDYLGRSRADVIGKTVHDVAPAELASVYEQADLALLAAGGRQIYDAQVRWADGSLRHVTFHKAVFVGQDGRAAGQAGAIFDTTEKHQLESRLRVLAETDELSGLFNRRSFIERTAERLLERRSTANPSLAVLMLDIDHFKRTNDDHGHAAGDAMLRHISQLVRAHLRKEDLIARIGGDEFAIALHITSDIQSVAARLPGLVAGQPLVLGSVMLPCSISVGAAVVDALQHRVDSALNKADMALYEAKRLGRNGAVMLRGDQMVPVAPA